MARRTRTDECSPIPYDVIYNIIADKIIFVDNYLKSSIFIEFTDLSSTGGKTYQITTFHPAMNLLPETPPLSL
jgi:hypothetical protein